MNKGFHFILPALLAGMSWADAAPVVLSKEKAEEMINRLVEIDSFDTGFSSTHGGLDFPPVAGQMEFGVATLFAPDVHERKKTVTHLVEAGPSVLPVLLAHLNDDRATKLTVTHGGGFGGMWHAAEVSAPDHAKEEAAAIAKAKLPEEDFANREDLDTYPVKVGDICFAVIGMITNRSYNAVRYQPTACIVINSPVKTPEIATAVREIWKDHADAAGLRAALERDFAEGSDSAATRLLYYFPQESSARVNARLKDLIAKKDDGLSRFLKAVAWAPDADLRAQIRSLLGSTKDPDIVVNGALAFAETGNAARRDEVVKLFQRWKTDKEDSECEAAGKLLGVALDTWADRAEDTLKTYLTKASRPAIIAGLVTSYGSGAVPVAPLRQLLEDQREGYGQYLKDGEGVQKEPQRGDYRPYRICDNTYEIICSNLGDRNARATGEKAAMNARILTLKARLAGDPAAWHFSEAEIAERQADRNKSAKSREETLGQIRKGEADETKQAVLILETKSLTLDDWREAAVRLYNDSKPDPDKPPGIFNQAPTLGTVLLNLDRPGECPIDRLDAEWQKRAVTILGTRAAGLLKATGPEEYPAEDTCGFYLLACARNPEANRPLQAKMLERLESALGESGFPGDAAPFRELMAVADSLLTLGHTGADAWFAKLCAKCAMVEEEDFFGLSMEEFFKVVARHAGKPAIEKAVEPLFLGAHARWNPANLDLSTADDLCGTMLLRLPAFRKALLAALRDNPQRHAKRGELTLDEDGKGFTIDYEGQGSHSSGIGEGEPCGAKPGGPPMEIRQVDALMEALGNYMFQSEEAEEMPGFHIYWPQDKRDEAIAKWIAKLAKE